MIPDRTYRVIGLNDLPPALRLSGGPRLILWPYLCIHLTAEWRTSATFIYLSPSWEITRVRCQIGDVYVDSPAEFENRLRNFAEGLIENAPNTIAMFVLERIAEEIEDLAPPWWL